MIKHGSPLQMSMAGSSLQTTKPSTRRRGAYITQPKAATTKPPTKAGRVNLIAPPVAEADAAAVVLPMTELDDPMDPELEVAVDPAAGVAVTVALAARETSSLQVTLDGMDVPSMRTKSEH